MTKFYGMIGYGLKVQTDPFIIDDAVVEHASYGDIVRDVRTYAEGESVNDSLTLGVNIRVMMEPFITVNFQRILYVEYLNTFWKVREVVPEYPGYLLRLGGVYNGTRAERPVID